MITDEDVIKLYHLVINGLLKQNIDARPFQIRRVDDRVEFKFNLQWGAFKFHEHTVTPLEMIADRIVFRLRDKEFPFLFSEDFLLGFEALFDKKVEDLWVEDDQSIQEG